MLALRKRKYQESLLAKTDAQLENLEQLVLHLLLLAFTYLSRADSKPGLDYRVLAGGGLCATRITAGERSAQGDSQRTEFGDR